MNKAIPLHSYDLITIGCSAGGIDSLRSLLPIISSEFPVPVVVIQHRSADSPQILQDYFSQICKAQVEEPDDKEPLKAGVIYFAPTNYHLLVDAKGCFNLSVDGPVNYSRPSIDVFFESAADAYGDRVLGIILSGANADGAIGLKAIIDRGGAALVQDPKTTEHPEMPTAAAVYASQQSIVTLDEIRNFFSELEGSICKK